MPTGYTAGILNGTTTTFQQFAKQCMRAFGATIHMRDESFDMEYIKREPSDYHLNAIDKAKRDLIAAEKLSDAEIVDTEKQRLEKDNTYHLTKISQIKMDRLKLESFLKDAKLFVPPTAEHEGIKAFMIEQLQSTINYDADTKYHDEALERNKKTLESINPADIRTDKIESANNDLTYHKKEHKDELDRCSKSDKWVTDFLNCI